METIVFWLIILVPFWIITRYVPLGLWFSAIMSDVKISILDIVKMKLMNIPPKIIVDNLIIATQAGLKISIDELQEHYLATGDVPKIIKALILAKKANVDLPFRQAAAIDLAGSDVLVAVEISINPVVINFPTVTAMTRDGIQLIVKGRVTIKANIAHLGQGAREEVLLARIGEGIVTAIGFAKSHADVLENPDEISRQVLAKKLDFETAFKIVKIEIIAVEIQKNSIKN